MTVRQEGDLIFLEGRCTAEEAEVLLFTLLDRPECVIDASGLTRAHLAVVQILLALKPDMLAPPADPVLANIIMDQSSR